MTTLLLLWLPLLALCAALPQEISDLSDRPVVLAADQNVYDVRPDVSLLIDPGGTYTFEEVVGDSLSARFISQSDGRLRFGYTSAVYWVRFPVEVRSGTGWLLEVAEKSLDHVAFKTSLPDSRIVEIGDDLPFGSRPIRHRRLLFPLPDAASYEVYLRIHSHGPVTIPLRILSENAILAETRKEEFALGMFFGVLAVMALYNGVLYASLRDVSYLFFALFIAFFALYQASVERIMFEYIWPGNPNWMGRANSLLGIVCAAWGILFTGSFLDTRRFAPVLHRVLIGLVVVGGMIFVLVGVGPVRLANQIAVYYFIAVVLVLLSCAVVCVLRQDRAAVYYLMGWSVLLVGVLAGMIGYLGLFSERISGVTSVRFAAFTGIVLLSQIGLGYRYDRMRRARQKLRIRIAHDLHDEIGSGLTEISLYSDLVRRNSAEKAAEWSEHIGERARALTEKMQDIVWALNTGNDTWDELELRMKDFSARLLAPKDIAFDIAGQARNGDDALPVEVRTNLLLMYKEIVHNAVKHGGCSRLTVRYRLESGHLDLDVSDDGCGFDPEQVRRHSGLRNIHARAEAMGADLVLDASPGGPCRYRISLPLNRNYPNE